MKIKLTLETQDVYPKNKRIIASGIDFNKEDYRRVSEHIGVVAPKFSITGNTGMLGPIDSQEPNSSSHREQERSAAD